MKIRLLIVGCFLVFIDCLGQSKVDDVLSFPLSDLELRSLNTRKNFLEENRFNSPWLRELDFRLRSNDSELDLEDYRLRFGLINPSEIKANRQLHQLLTSQNVFEKQVLLNDILLRRYELLIESYYVDRLLSVNDAFLKILNDIKEIVGTESVDIVDIIDLEMEITKLDLENQRLDQQKDVLLRALKQFEQSDFPDWDQFGLIQPKDIEAILNTNEFDSLNVIVQAKIQDIRQEESILALKKAESYGNIGFLQAEYDIERGNSFERHFGFQIGINIPIFNRDRPTLQRRELDLIEERLELDLISENELQLNILDVQEIKNTIERYNIIESKYSDFERLKALAEENGIGIKGYQKLAAFDHFLLKKGAVLSAEILTGFIKLMHKFGRLAETPYVNYLSQDLRTFELSMN